MAEAAANGGEEAGMAIFQPYSGALLLAAEAAVVLVDSAVAEVALADSAEAAAVLAVAVPVAAGRTDFEMLKYIVVS